MYLSKRFVLLILLFVFPMLSYAALPPEVQKDRALMAFSEHLKNEQYKEAEKYFRKLLDLRDKHKVILPNSVYYFGAETVYHTGYHIWAETLLTKYITMEGQKGKYYTKALQLLNEVEPKAIKLRTDIQARKEKKQAAKKAAQLKAKNEREAAEKKAEESYKADIAIARQRQQEKTSKLFPDTLADGFMLIPSDVFLMGSRLRDSEKPVHQVVLKSFGMSKYEVTYAEYNKFCQESNWKNCYLLNDKKRLENDYPVDFSRWEDANAYAHWLSQKTGKSFRLPSEAEWEYAARAGSLMRYSSGNVLETNVAHFIPAGTSMEKAIRDSAPVGSYIPNAFGLYDVHGNVSEWVSDCFHKNYLGAPKNGKPRVNDNGHCSNRIIRGGNWILSPEWLTSTARIGVPLDYSELVGFRLVQEISSEEIDRGEVRYSLLESIDMVNVPAGVFVMGDHSTGLFSKDGDDDELPEHEVTISAFKMSKNEITREQYDAFCELTGREKLAGDGPGNMPVTNVSWEDAKAFTTWLSEQTGGAFRLPTEVEWEYAARAGTDTPYSWGKKIERNRAVCDGCKSQWDNISPAPTGSFEANTFGLNDMHGNVSEWVEDCYHENYQGAPADGTSWSSDSCSERVIRGGGWSSKPADLRSANRGRVVADHQGNDVGFRIVQSQ